MANKYFFTITFLFISASVFCQKPKEDSLQKLLAIETTDTGKVRLMWQLADVITKYNPDTARNLAQQAVYLSKKTKGASGASLCAGNYANHRISR